MAATKMVVKRKSHILFKLFVLFLIVLAAYGAWLYLSTQKLRDLMTQVEQSYASMEESLDSKDYQQALADARTMADITDQVTAELDGVQWEIAAHAPVLGVEVETARSLSRISGSFANDGALPVFDAWDTLAADGLIVNGQFDLDHLKGKADQIGQLMNAIENADAVTDQCAAQLDEIPTSRFAELNEWSDKLDAALTSASDSLDGIADAIGYINGLSELFSDLIGGSEASA